jgi:hypothetical protein
MKREVVGRSSIVSDELDQSFDKKKKKKKNKDIDSQFQNFGIISFEQDSFQKTPTGAHKMRRIAFLGFKSYVAEFTGDSLFDTGTKILFLRASASIPA